MFKASSWHRLLFATAAILTLAACTQRQAPDPSMTAVAGQRTAGDSLDWISPEDVARAEALGLSMRDAAFDANGDGERIEGLLPSVYFDFDQSNIRADDRPALQEAYDYLQNNREARLIIEGHCDWRGTTEYNMALGDRRARSAKQYLTQLGIADERIETVSYGDLQAETEADERQMARDRRADLIIVRARR
ncbi:MAG: OmpA family protein [Opitutales bacterium]|nr:OmpA family protein [Opitutales bacterium]